MNSKHRKTLAAISAKVKALSYRDVKGLLLALGVVVEEREGSRVALKSGGDCLVIHRPHPGKEIKAYQVKQLKEFFEQLGIEPEK